MSTSSDVSAGIGIAAQLFAILPSIFQGIKDAESFFGSGQGSTKKAAVMAPLAGQSTEVQQAASKLVDTLVPVVVSQSTQPFIPQFETAPIFVPGPNGQTRVNPIYALTDASAAILCEKLNASKLFPATITVVLLPPFSQQQGGDPVSWFDFGNSLRRNAGLVASTWTHNYPDSYSLNWTLRSVQQMYADAGLGDPPSADPVHA